MNRCCNIDWLEVFVSEPLDSPRDADYYRHLGYVVNVREYGTPQYREMFTIFEGDFPLLEVRRNPYSLRALGGIFQPNDCHIRISNRSCYAERPIDNLRAFLMSNNYSLKGITRIDLCLDFNLFDKGDNPEKVILQYMQGKLAKINQSKIAVVGKEQENIFAHGRDSWRGRVWNSISWGAPSSCVKTKLYNKSLELKEVKDKFYIRDCWAAAGLRQDIPVWRVEFSLNSQAKAFVNVADGMIIETKLSSFDTKDKCLLQFHRLAHHYFHFKIVEYDDKGKPKRKDRCKDKQLIYLHSEEQNFKPLRLTQNKEPSRTDKLLLKRLRQIKENEANPRSVRNAAQEVGMHIGVEMRAAEEWMNEMILTSEQKD